ncbi:hypothetical protein J5N97_017853 [Dioscorea zingiberensis]|uniref:Uncharacterized protein n=1 Tax=Dioscorea zingiberensis TaxID=325984 RepID=A0A9D5HGX9_9LILI|nr:hypothetical protein J5N97_017853 [Dioscorea zingiberensis]
MGPQPGDTGEDLTVVCWYAAAYVQVWSLVCRGLCRRLLPWVLLHRRAGDHGVCLSETYGPFEIYSPSTVCACKPEWDQLPPETRAKLHCRQGVRYLALENLDLVDVKTMVPVPADGVTLGEIVMRGNGAIKG